MEPFAAEFARLILAAFLSSLIGTEREKSHKPAGLRTHVLVCMGAALAVIIGDFYYNVDAGKIAAAVITGIGFLGAGAIIWSHQTKGNGVHGLTTAASLWLVAVLGIAVGSGAYLLSLVFTLLTLLVLRIKRIEKKL